MNEPLINAEELLTWYVDAGIDVALSDEPIDRFAQSAIPAKASKSTVPPQTNLRQTEAVPTAAARPAIEHAIPDNNAVAMATELADQASSLEELKQVITGFEGCNLKFTARSTVFSDGNPKAKVMLVGEAPRREEDAEGIPFVGRSGQLLDRMLASIELDRTQVYISTVLPWRPPGNRLPTPAETEICRPFIEKHIELVNPEILVLIGGATTGTLLRSKSGIMSLRGKWTDLTIGERSFPTLPMLHPEYLLRTPSHKKLAWSDLLALKAKLSIR